MIDRQGSTSMPGPGPGMLVVFISNRQGMSAITERDRAKLAQRLFAQRLEVWSLADVFAMAADQG